MINKTVSHYHIVEKLGEGGMGVVYKAKDLKLERFVALKFLPLHLKNEFNEKERFIQEAKAASALDHPNICTIYEINEAEDGQMYIAMGYYEGETLKSRIENGLKLKEALDIAEQIAQGLNRAHQNSIIHRDIKPANIIVTRHNEAKIVDFGLAKLAGKAHLTKTGLTVGTAAYMSPEQIQSREVDHRADIFAFGVVFYQMLTGRLPFQGDYEPALFYSILHHEAEPVSQANPEVPSPLDPIVARSLAKNPDDRYQNLQELLAELQPIKAQIDFGNLESGASTGLQKKNRSGKKRPAIQPRSKTIGILASIILVLVLVIFLVPTIRNGLGNLADLSKPKEKHIAVLAFTNIGNDPANQSLCDGLVEILTSKISQLEQFEGALWVVPASEVRSNKITSAREALTFFGVNLVITGSVQRFSSMFRLTMNLIDARNQRQLNSTMTDYVMDNVSFLQDEAVIKLAGMLNIELLPKTQRILTAGATAVPGAYEFYVQGRGTLQGYDKIENIEAAVSLFNSAIKADPDYALAYAGLGEAYLRKYEATKETKWVAEARKNCQQAVAIDNVLAPVHVTLGLLQIENGEYQQSLLQFQNALELDSHNANAYRGRAKAYMALGMLDEAEATYKNAIKIKPDYWGGYNDLGVFYFRHGRYEEAIPQFKYVTSLTPQNVRGYSNLGSMYFSLNQYSEAINIFNKALAIKPDYSIYSNLATLYFYQGHFRDAAKMYEKALELADTDYRVWGYLATAYKRSGSSQDKVNEATQRAIQKAEENLTVNPNDPDVLTSLAGYYLEFGEKSKSLSLLQQVINLNPKDVAIMFRIGYAFEQLEKRDEALSWFEKALANGYPLEEIENNPGLNKLRSDVKYEKFKKRYKK